MPLDVLARCHPAGALVLTTLAASMRPAPKLSVSAWAERFRVVSAESGSRYPGPWRNDRAPHLVDVMDALGPNDPCEDVVLVASAQVGKSECGVNFFGYVVAQDPGPMILVLPSHDESIKYVRTKMQPAIDETPQLRARVLEMTNRTERGSTASYKRFRGGFAQVTFAGSSKGLQMLSAKYTIADEVSEWPATAGERGDPVEQLKVRTKTYERDRKRLWVSTPAIAGTCRISADYDVSDKRRRYVPCPHCGAYQVLTFDHLKWDSETWPHRAWFECAASGCVISHLEKADMMARGVWLATAGDEAPGPVVLPDDLAKWRDRPALGQMRGFHIWQAYSLFTSWDSIVSEYLRARGGHERMRVFTQQVLGEAWEDRGDAPEAEKLHGQRLSKDDFSLGTLPHGPVVLTGAVDVQGNRLEWAVWGWSEGMTRWLVDRGVVQGDPNDEATWRIMGQVMQGAVYRGADPEAPALEVDAWAVDSGYCSHAVYMFTRGRPRCFAVDGRFGRTEPMVGSPKKVEVRWSGKRLPKGATLWPVGTFALKSDLYAAIRKTVAGPSMETGQFAPGAMILPGDLDLAYVEQLTAEHLVEKEMRSGVVQRVWQKLSGRPNEALDIACYARAMAFHLKLDRLTPEGWAALRADRKQKPVQASLFDVAQPVPDTSSAPPAPAVAPEAPADPTPTAPRAAGQSWLKPKKGRWL
jgi:phage terminase large subunit GpA-like protein